MKRDFFAGATYVDARPDGQFAVLFPNPVPVAKAILPPAIQLRDRVIGLPNQANILTSPLGDLPLYHRITADGTFKIGAQVADRDPSQPGKGTWEWTADIGWQQVDPASYGVNATIYQGQTLFISNPGWGSQGFRYIETISNNVITGDDTYNDHTSWAIANDVHALGEWTKQYDIVVGQDPVSGCIATCMGRRYVLEPGNVTFIRFVCLDGEQCAVSIVKPDGAVILWFTRTELLSDFFPEQSGQQPGPIVPIEPPIAPGEPMPIAPNKLTEIRAIAKAHPEIHGTVDGPFAPNRGGITQIAALDFKYPFGRKSRDGSATNLSDDALCYQLPDGRFEIYDILMGWTGAPGQAPPPNEWLAVYSYAGTFAQGENGYFVVPSGSAPPQPVPGPTPPSPGNPVNVNKDDVRDGSNAIISFYNEPIGLNRAARGIPSPIDVHDQACWDWIALYTTHLAHGDSKEVAYKKVIDQIKTFPEYKEQHP